MKQRGNWPCCWNESPASSPERARRPIADDRPRCIKCNSFLTPSCRTCESWASLFERLRVVIGRDGPGGAQIVHQSIVLTFFVKKDEVDVAVHSTADRRMSVNKFVMESMAYVFGEAIEEYVTDDGVHHVLFPTDLSESS